MEHLGTLPCSLLAPLAVSNVSMWTGNVSVTNQVATEAICRRRGVLSRMERRRCPDVCGTSGIMVRLLCDYKLESVMSVTRYPLSGASQFGGVPGTVIVNRHAKVMW